MIEQWQELKETIIELRDNDGTGTQQEVCKFLANLMDVLEKQMSNQNKGDLISRQAVEDITWEEPSYTDPLNVLTEVREKVRALPSVENKGEWLLYGYVSTKQIENCTERYCCSKCHNIISRDFRYFKFCPNCGARMKGGE